MEDEKGGSDRKGEEGVLEGVGVGYGRGGELSAPLFDEVWKRVGNRRR